MICERGEGHIKTKSLAVKLIVKKLKTKCNAKEGREKREREISSSSDKGLQRKKLETVTLPVTQLTSPDKKKKKQFKRRSGQEPGEER